MVIWSLRNYTRDWILINVQVTKLNLLHGDCLDILPTLEADSIDSCVTDPPYGLSFMGKDWDHGVPGEHFWIEVMRVLKPGAHLLAFGGTRTYHRLTCAIEDAGFEIRDCLMWVYGSGFPKSQDVSKAIDKLHGAEREVIGPSKHHSPGRLPTNTLRSFNKLYNKEDDGKYDTAPATEDAKKWDGWGTALKPAYESIILARKPFKGTVAQNVLEYGTGGMNIDACRVDSVTPNDANHRKPSNMGHDAYDTKKYIYAGGIGGRPNENLNSKGRFPSNFIHDGSEEVTGLFPETASGGSPNSIGSGAGNEITPGWGNIGKSGTRPGVHDSGSAARFFYTAKSSKSERATPGTKNSHPTVKPISLMRYLCKLITPPKGIVLDPFMGSGSTGLACIEEGFGFTGIELDKHYHEIAQNRINNAQPTLF